VIDCNKELPPKVQGMIVGTFALLWCSAEAVQFYLVVGLLGQVGWNGLMRGVHVGNLSTAMPVVTLLLAVAALVAVAYGFWRRKKISDCGLGFHHFILPLISLSICNDIFRRILNASDQVPIRPMGFYLTIKLLLGFGTLMIWCVIISLSLHGKLPQTAGSTTSQSTP
jgi:hypothetical protein